MDFGCTKHTPHRTTVPEARINDTGVEIFKCMERKISLCIFMLICHIPPRTQNDKNNRGFFNVFNCKKILSFPQEKLFVRAGGGASKTIKQSALLLLIYKLSVIVSKSMNEWGILCK